MIGERCPHGDEWATKHHCDGSANGAAKCPDPGLGICHTSAYCRRCDRQWIEYCPEHQASGA